MINRRAFIASLASFPLIGGVAAFASSQPPAELTWDDINRLAENDAEGYIIVHANQIDYARLKPLTPDESVGASSILLRSSDEHTVAFSIKDSGVSEGRILFRMVEYTWHGRWVRASVFTNQLPTPVE